MPRIFEYLGILLFSIQMSMNQFMFMGNTVNMRAKLNSILLMGKLSRLKSNQLKDLNHWPETN